MAFKYQVVLDVYSNVKGMNSVAGAGACEHPLARHLVQTNDKGRVGIVMMDEVARGNLVCAYDNEHAQLTAEQMFDLRKGIHPTEGALPDPEQLERMTERIVQNEEELDLTSKGQNN